MAIVGSLFALVGRFAGRLLNSALGWATLLLFGKVEGRKQTLLLVIALASLLWVLVVASVVVPDLGTFLLAFVPVPEFIDEGIVRLAMLGLAILIPLLIGIAAIYVADAATRPHGLGLVGGVLRGYPFTLLLAVTIALLAAVSLVRKVRSLSKRWEDAHVPVVVKPGGYDRVLADLHGVLDAAGLDVEPRPAPGVLSIPPRLLDAVAGKALGGLVPDRLFQLVGDEVEILVYPSDVAIAGSKRATARARAAIADRLTESPAYLTTSAEAERLEDEIRKLATAPIEDRVVLQQRLRELDRSIAQLMVPFDEWETVYRQRLQVERDLLAGQLGEPATPALGTERGLSRAPGDSSAASRLVGWAGLALVALDVVLVLADRLGSARPRR